MTNFKNNPRYSSINIEEALIFKNTSANKMTERSGVPTISKFGFTIPFRTKPQHKEIISFLKTFKSEGRTIQTIINELSPKQAAAQLKAQFNFSNNILKSII
jgi:cephalosporin-C deacetylase-like acetyl esterase